MCTYMYCNILALNVSLKKKVCEKIMKDCLFIACQIKSLKTLLSFHKYTEQVLDHLIKSHYWDIIISKF